VSCQSWFLSHQTMAHSKEQCKCIKYCFKLGKTTTETLFVGTKQWAELKHVIGLPSSEADRHLLIMPNVQNVHWQAKQMKMLHTSRKISMKTDTSLLTSWIISLVFHLIHATKHDDTRFPSWQCSYSLCFVCTGISGQKWHGCFSAYSLLPRSCTLWLSPSSKT